MKERLRTPTLIGVGVIDLVCFVLGGMDYGEVWSGIGVVGLLLFLALFEFL